MFIINIFFFLSSGARDDQILFFIYGFKYSKVIFFSFQMTDEQIVLLSTEIDAFVEALDSFELEDIGKPR